MWTAHTRLIKRVVVLNTCQIFDTGHRKSLQVTSSSFTLRWTSVGLIYQSSVLGTKQTVVSSSSPNLQNAI